MCAAVWSVPFETVLKFPIVVLVRFWVNHHLLDLFQRPVWRVVKGRGVQYVNRVRQGSLNHTLLCSASLFKSHRADLEDVRLGCEVQCVTSEGNRVLVKSSMDAEWFDSVVMATHSDVTLKILGPSASAEEKSILGAIPYESNDVYLHTGHEG